MTSVALDSAHSADDALGLRLEELFTEDVCASVGIAQRDRTRLLNEMKGRDGSPSIITAGELIRHTKRSLLRGYRVGSGTFKRMVLILSAAGLSLREEPPRSERSDQFHRI